MLKKLKYIRKLTLVFCFILLGLITNCSKNNTVTNPIQASNVVLLQNKSFVPVSLTVSVGTTVKWNNVDTIAYTVTSGAPDAPDGKFDSGDLQPGAAYSYTFTTKGTYQYYCKYFSSVMTGTIVVQ